MREGHLGDYGGPELAVVDLLPVYRLEPPGTGRSEAQTRAVVTNMLQQTAV